MAQLMAQVAIDTRIYEQAQFVPPSLMDQWSESFFTLGPVFEWLGIREEVVTAVCQRLVVLTVIVHRPGYGKEYETPS